MLHGDPKELILHIGRSKSGTSSLQHYLTRNRKQLASQGICYPTTGCEGRVAQHDIALACRRLLPYRRGLRRLRSEFQAEVADFDRIIVSSEAFQNLLTKYNLNFFFGRRLANPAGVLSKILRRRPRAYRIKTICYIREYLEFACSSYSQHVQNSSQTDGLVKYCASHFRRPLSSFAALWQRFSDEAIFVYYDRQRLINEDVVDDFFHRIPLTAPSARTSHNANPSISGNLLAFKLLLNRQGLHRPTLYRTFAELAREDQRYRGRIFLSDIQARALRSRFAAYNVQLTQLVGDIREKSFEGGNKFDAANWTADVERFLEHPELAPLKDQPEIYRASAQSAAALLD